MTTSAKIRVLLALLFASLLLTAIVVQKTYTLKNNLFQTAQTLEENLQKKETFVTNIINDKTRFDKLKTLEHDEQEALKTIKTFTTDENIWATTYKNGKLVFWSGIKVISERPNAVHEGFSFVREANGYYAEIKKSEGNFSAIFYIPVKLNYSTQNQYLQNTFAKNLLNDKNIEIAEFYDKNFYVIRSIDGTDLFSVKVRENEVSHKFFYFEVIIWVLCAVVLSFFVHSICNYIAVQGYVYVSSLLLILFIVSIRFLNLHYHWPDFTYKPELFSTNLYASTGIFRSLGDLCLNVLCISWFVTFIYLHRDKLSKHIYNKIAGYGILVFWLLILFLVSTSLLRLFYSLVITSHISFDVNNVLNLSIYSVLGVLMLCFSFMIFYLLTETSLTVCNKLAIPVLHQVIMLSSAVIIATLIAGHYDNEFTIFYILMAAWVLLRGYGHLYDQGRLNSGTLALIILLCAVLSAIKLNHFQSIKESENRKKFIQELESPDDVTADRLFKKVDKNAVTDPVIQRFFMTPVKNTDFLKDYFQRKYFDGYLENYEFTLYGLNERGESLSNDKDFDRSVFSNMIEVKSYFKFSDHFYREKNTFGIQKYLAILPITKNGDVLGTVAIELTSKTLKGESEFPDLLVDGKAESDDDDDKNYAYAFYTDNVLVNQHGKYVYSLTNNEFKGKLNDFVTKITNNAEPSRNGASVRYKHLIYQQNKRNLIVVSKEDDVVISTITSVTFFFIVFLVFSVIVLTGRWLWARIRIMYIKDNYLHWVLKLNFDKILYKTRIQFSIVLAVVITLVLVGIITYISIANQYDEQQDNTISNKISRIATAFENGNLNSVFSRLSDEDQVKFDEFANTYASDLTLFNTNGVELISTQPKMYEQKLIAPRINAKAYIYLKKLQKSEYINDEIIGELKYKAAYVPVKNNNITVGYLQLPYFSNEAEYKTRVGSLLNAMINVYALIFIAIGLLAIFIARQITNPLNIIQQGLSKTIYGQKNEPIKWQRNDEIGALVAEYNNMIAALEQSAQKLAQSERESAWREMAKQVAHEIKNPLTPLKLGLQLLEKSWRDKDPKFDQKFERFSKSFVEQIESLSSIASEFSAFAKMPDTRIVRMDVFEALTQAVTVFKQMDNIRILFTPPDTPFYINADRDQLLRCFNNLLKNAIEAMPHGVEGLIEINYLITSKNILLSVKDNGNGIPENLREKIFEPNFTTKSSGTGLGLAFVKNSIENAGGKVWFETIIGTGTTFYFSLPEST